jgi:hypothetical protein
MDFFFWQTQPVGKGTHDEFRSLRWPINIRTFCRYMGVAINGLHGVVCQERSGVGFLDYLCCFLKSTFRISISASAILAKEASPNKW